MGVHCDFPHGQTRRLRSRKAKSVFTWLKVVETRLGFTELGSRAQIFSSCPVTAETSRWQSGLHQDLCRLAQLGAQGFFQNWVLVLPTGTG